MMLECAFKMEFFGFLRSGEFTCRSQYDYEHVARLQDISFEKSDKFYVFNLRSFKCDPFGRGVKITIFENNVFKPVATMNKYMYIRMRFESGATRMSPLYVEDERNTVPLRSFLC